MPPAPSLTRRDFLQRSATLTATSLLASRLSPHLHAGEPAGAFRSSWDRARDGIWLGPEFWANPLQDWQVANQRIECVNAAADRNVHLLTRQLSSRPGTLELRVRIGRADGVTLAGKGSAGFRIGILGTLKDYPALHDYRNNLWPAPNAGFNAGFTAAGTIPKRDAFGHLHELNHVKAGCETNLLQRIFEGHSPCAPQAGADYRHAHSLSSRSCPHEAYQCPLLRAMPGSHYADGSSSS